MTTSWNRIDELVRTVLPRARVPEGLTPRHLLDPDVAPEGHAADKVLALRELVRSGGRSEALGSTIRSSADVAAYFVPLLGADTMESLHVAGLDSRNAVRVVRCVARGDSHACAVSVAGILRVPILNGCPALLLVHNHPSGDPTPSADDIELTRRLREAATLLGLRLLDHVIVGAGRHHSFLDAGLLEAR